MTRLRITRSKRTKMDLDTITQSTQAVDITRAPNVQTRRASAQASASCQEESSPLATKLNLIWKTIKELKDNKGRTYSELFINLPDKELYPDYFGVIKNPIALNIIKQKIVDGKYLKEEDFEKDLDLMCSNAKVYNIEGSQVHNDAITIQKFARKLLRGDKEQDKSVNGSTNLEKIEHNGEIYHVGDFVHIFNEVDPGLPNIAHIQKIWENKEGDKFSHVCWYYRPEQTKHQATHKFYENEVFKTSGFLDISFNDVVEKCYVLQHKDYIAGRPEGSDGMSVYLCKSRYSEQQTNFIKIKKWPGKKINLVRYDKPLVLKKVESALAANFRKSKDKNKEMTKEKNKEKPREKLKDKPKDKHKDKPRDKTREKQRFKAKSEELRKELLAKYEYDADSSHPEDPFFPSQASRVRNSRVGRPPKSQGTDKKFTPITYQKYPTNYDDSDNFTPYTSSVPQSPYSMTSGYPITSTPLTDNVQNTGVSHQYGFVTSPQETPMPSIHSIPSQYLAQPFYQVDSESTVPTTSIATATSTVQQPIVPSMSKPKSGAVLEIPPETAEYFARDQMGNVLWFASPPIDVVQVPEPMHSIEYLCRRKELLERDRKRKLQEAFDYEDYSNPRFETPPRLIELDLLSDIEELGNKWKNDATFLNRQLDEIDETLYGDS